MNKRLKESAKALVLILIYILCFSNSLILADIISRARQFRDENYLYASKPAEMTDTYGNWRVVNWDDWETKAIDCSGLVICSVDTGVGTGLGGGPGGQAPCGTITITRVTRYTVMDLYPSVIYPRLCEPIDWDDMEQGDLLLVSGTPGHAIIFIEFENEAKTKLRTIESRAGSDMKVIEISNRNKSEFDNYQPSRFKVDNTNPGITISGAENNGTYNAAVTIKYWAADNIEWNDYVYAKGRWRKDGGNWQDFVQKNTKGEGGVTLEEDGEYTIRVYARDWAGNEFTKEITFTIETICG